MYNDEKQRRLNYGLSNKFVINTAIWAIIERKSQVVYLCLAIYVLDNL